MQRERARFFRRRSSVNEYVALSQNLNPGLVAVRKVTEADRTNHRAAYAAFKEPKMASEAKGLGEAVKGFKETLKGIVSGAKDEVVKAEAEAAAVGSKVKSFASDIRKDLAEINDLLSQETNSPPSDGAEDAPAPKKGIFR